MDSDLEKKHLEERIEELEHRLDLRNLAEKSLIHDLRNKNQIQQGNLEIAITGLEPGDEISEQDYQRLEMAYKNINQIEDLISKQESLHEADGKQDYQLLDICDVLDQNIESLQCNIRLNDVEVERDYSNVVNPEVYTTPLINNSIYNILDNSIDYGDDLINVAVYDSEDFVEAVIADNGDGIPEDLKESMFPDEDQELSEYPSRGSAIIHQVSVGTNIEIEQGISEYGGSEYRLKVFREDI